MAQESKIEWLRPMRKDGSIMPGHTCNLWWGCVTVHEGCDNCYASTLSNRLGNDLWGNDKPRKEIKKAFSDLDRYQKLAQEANEQHLVFVGSMMDIFEKPMLLLNRSYYTEKLRQLLFAYIDTGRYPNLLFLLLTKRETNINKYTPESWKSNPPENVMFGTSVVNQKTFDRVTENLKAVNGKKFLSMEPQLDYIKLGKLEGIDWLIQGGESGHHKRPFNTDWARSMRDECAALGIPYFFKQIDKVQAIPDDLQIRQFPL